MQKKTRMVPVESGPATHLKIQLYYSKGGMNYFSGTTERRGIYLSVSPVSVFQGNGYTTETYTGFSGVKELVEECARFNPKRFEAMEEPADRVKALVEHVCAKNGITVKEQ